MICDSCLNRKNRYEYEGRKGFCVVDTFTIFAYNLAEESISSKRCL